MLRMGVPMPRSTQARDMTQINKLVIIGYIIEYMTCTTVTIISIITITIMLTSAITNTRYYSYYS